ncbi:MAG: DUF393 domain-containing protein [Candidatus Nitrohelix vancouverensis]|uniref:Lipase maturation factor 2 n=1 Tax=Candidatus Nitrohelix vancouverensis TaxID=2705534 RepID=A0A7T0C4U0_9BACT|nr:MAG: DUF393 domain-containing protein [Candidatus Nitrohelix vancouverensis]
MATIGKPLLIYDGDCGFCLFWIERWGHVTADRVDYAPYQEVASRFPNISREQFEKSVQLVEPDGSVYAGAEAVFRALSHAPGALAKWPLGCYRKLPGASRVCEAVYRAVANRRMELGAIQRWCGSAQEEYLLARRLILVLLACIYFIAFGSLALQATGLLGSQGILPLESTLQAFAERGGEDRLWRYPTLFWINSSDAFLMGVCFAGMALALLAALGAVPMLVFFLLWFLYLSIVQVGGIFMGYQWDTLLLEAGVIAILLSPLQWWMAARARTEPSILAIWLCRLLLFKVMFSSGWVKAFGGDSNWTELRALNFHYETQPLPTWLGWYAHQLPTSIQQVSVFVVFLIQLAVPFLIFGSRKCRVIAFFAFLFLQTLILLTGNYCFFNALTLTLCISLLDDDTLKRWAPVFFNRRGATLLPKPLPLIHRTLIACFAMIWLVLTIWTQTVPMIDRSYKPSGLIAQANRWVSPFHSINSYGLFAWMTTLRREIVIQGSRDGKEWLDYTFKWKPGALDEAPRFVAPHQPRLDWQMWFAALGNYKRNFWLLRMMDQMLKGSQPVLGLFADNPFPERPPRYLRAVLFDYKFTDWETKSREGKWWKRERLGLYAPVLESRDRD